jgi:AraC family transcriptional regulator
MRSEYSWIPAGNGPTRTGPYQVGVSFSQHRAAVFETAQRTVDADIAGGSVFVTGRDPISWLRIAETTEALEVYPDRELLRSLGRGDTEFELAAPTRDGTVLAISSILKRVHAGGAELDDTTASTLAHRLAAHMLARYCHVPVISEWDRGRLDRVTVDRVTEFVDAGLAGALTLDALAAVASMSPFHFAREFKATTGVAPHQFVMARRVHRATSLLLGTAEPVADIARAVGLSNIGHFRRVFRRHMGVLPGDLRQNSKIGPSAAPGRVEASNRDSDPVPAVQR